MQMPSPSINFLESDTSICETTQQQLFFASDTEGMFRYQPPSESFRGDILVAGSSYLQDLPPSSTSFDHRSKNRG